MWARGALFGMFVIHALTMSVDIVEFVRIVRSPDSELRDRFNLPPHCDPIVTAVRKPSEKVRVSITCLAAADRRRSPEWGRSRP